MRTENEANTVGEFLRIHYEKFAIMGIFGTVSVFLTRGFPGGTDTLAARAGTLASLLIFSLAAAWLSLRAFGNLVENANERSVGRNGGFTVIVLCTSTLFFTIMGASLNFNIAGRLLFLSFVMILSVISYAKFYPKHRYEFDFLDGAEIVMGASMLVTLLITDGLQQGINFWVDQFTMDQMISEIVFIPFIMGLHLAWSEGIAGVAVVVQYLKGDRSKNAAVSEGNYLLSIAVAITLVSVSAFQYYLSSYEAVDGVLYYSILGRYWQTYVAFHWAILASAVLLVLHTRPWSESVEKSAIPASLLIAAVIFIEVILCIFNVIGSTVAQF